MRRSGWGPWEKDLLSRHLADGPPVLSPIALADAHRARAIATIARTRAAKPTPVLDDTSRTALRKIAELLDAAAHALETKPATINNGDLHFPADAWLSLQAAEAVALAHPGIGIPRTLGQYVTAALYPHDKAESEVDLPLSLLPCTSKAIVREADLFGRLLGLHGAPRFVTDQATTTLVLEDVFRLHWQHARLADSLAADRARSGGALPAAVEIPMLACRHRRLASTAAAVRPTPHRPLGPTREIPHSSLKRHPPARGCPRRGARRWR